MHCTFRVSLALGEARHHCSESPRIIRFVQFCCADRNSVRSALASTPLKVREQIDLGF